VKLKDGFRLDYRSPLRLDVGRSFELLMVVHPKPAEKPSKRVSFVWPASGDAIYLPNVHNNFITSPASPDGLCFDDLHFALVFSLLPSPNFKSSCDFISLFISYEGRIYKTESCTM
jgi:hypothetical protein